MKFISLFVFLISLHFFALAQNEEKAIKILGHVIDGETRLSVDQLLILNKRTGNGFWGQPDGRFEIVVLQSDTIIISGIGYNKLFVTFKDSVYHPFYNFETQLSRLSVNLKEVEVIPLKSFDEIERERKLLGYKPSYSVRGVSAFESPVTALYERFSKMEQSKREVERLRNEDAKKAVLKELFKIFVDASFIDLEEQDFEHFIDYMNLSDQFLVNASDYELVTTVKKYYAQYVKDYKEYYAR